MNSENINSNMNNSIPECGNSSKDFECERPLKKARYMWQLKGKYYLKNEYKRCTSQSVGTSKELQKKDDINMNNIPHGNVGMYNKTAPNSSTSKSTYIHSSNNQTNECIEDVPLSMVQNNNEEYLHKWQTKRIAQSFIDNTINMILENWKISPFDAADLVENCANGGQVEDEGILMAIQSHGLQSSGGCVSSTASRASINNSNKQDFIQCQDSSSAFSSTPTNTRFNNSDLDRTFLFQSTIDNYTNTQNETMQQTSEIASDCSSYNESNQDYNEFKTDDSLDFLRTAVSVAIEKKGLSYTY